MVCSQKGRTTPNEKLGSQSLQAMFLVAKNGKWVNDSFTHFRLLGKHPQAPSTIFQIGCAPKGADLLTE